MQTPLVSVAIITYNSSEFVLETLESIKGQTYENIELIISDDNSKDDTIEICRRWLNDNKGHFVRTQLITSDVNTGVVGNANRALEALRGEWIKFLAGDDLLLPHCIESNMAIAAKYPGHRLFVSKIVAFDSSTGRDIKIIPEQKIAPNNGPIQLKGILKGNYIKAPGVFLKKSLLVEVGGFDVRYPMVEDTPLWIKLNLVGYYFIENPEVLVKYRLHEKSLSSGRNYFLSPIFYPSLKKFVEEMMYPVLKKKKMYRRLIYLKTYFWIANRVMKKGNNIKDPRNLIERVLLKIVWVLQK